MVGSEDFSFPTISNPIPLFAISPSLWHVSSIVYPDEDDQKVGRFNLGGNDARRTGRFQSGEIEEKMDMLWENFNEELTRVEERRQSKSEKIDVCCVKAMNMVRKGSELECDKRPSNRMMMILKVLKKVFLLTTSRPNPIHSN
ncbi:uncharacterized protein LOC110808623 [Carica papaya]|uniref:uncharacterized protein LOC110808623 n=1 Tax=Carica papaya TaxID=3649 RepID=UPI000B8CF34B|nr:uncharacterized protein LOC110808623 [Carica papaya]